VTRGPVRGQGPRACLGEARLKPDLDQKTDINQFCLSAVWVKHAFVSRSCLENPPSTTLQELGVEGGAGRAAWMNVTRLRPVAPSVLGKTLGANGVVRNLGAPFCQHLWLNVLRLTAGAHESGHLPTYSLDRVVLCRAWVATGFQPCLPNYCCPPAARPSFVA